MYCVLRVTIANWIDCETRHGWRRTFIGCAFVKAAAFHALFPLKNMARKYCNLGSFFENWCAQWTEYLFASAAPPYRSLYPLIQIFPLKPATNNSITIWLTEELWLEFPVKLQKTNRSHFKWVREWVQLNFTGKNLKLFGLWRCCQTKEPKHQYSFDEGFY